MAVNDEKDEKKEKRSVRFDPAGEGNLSLDIKFNLHLLRLFKKSIEGSDNPLTTDDLDRMITVIKNARESYNASDSRTLDFIAQYMTKSLESMKEQIKIFNHYNNREILEKISGQIREGIEEAISEKKILQLPGMSEFYYDDLQKNFKYMTPRSSRKYEQAKIRSEEESRQQAIMEDSLEKLVSAVLTMKNYGESLEAKSVKKGEIIKEMADCLLDLTDRYKKEKFTSNKPEHIKAFKSEFRDILRSKNAEIKQTRTNWNTIIKNILIALSGVGTVAIAAKLIHSKITHGRALFFDQKEKTTSETHIDDINNALNKMTPLKIKK